MPCMIFDQDPNGYKAVVHTFEGQPRWLERNVDVLVQLLQSGAFPPGLLLSLLYVFNVVVDGSITFADEPAEVAVIKMVLIQHLELDSKVTLGVLCDQIVPPDDPMEDEDKTIRKRPEALVVAFLAEDVWKPFLAQLQGQRRGAAEQEDALIDTLIKAVSKSSTADAAKIIEDILIFLPSFNDGRQRDAGTMSREDLPPGRNPESLEQSRGYLKLSNLLCHAKVAADLAQLLRFYCTSFLMRKMTVGRLPQARARSSSLVWLTPLQRAVVDALTIILLDFIQVAPSDAQACGSCEILLHTCQQRKEQQTNWTIPAPLVSVLSEISHLADEQESPKSKQVADLIRALTRHPLLGKPPPPPPNTKEFVDAPPLSKRKAGCQAPGMPQEQNGPQKLSIRGQHVHQRRHPKDITSSSSPQQSMCSGVSTSVEAADDDD
ncbi:hypothetical protein EDB85DRAFT_2179177 [Lactarius pseudohatsudake]|nr:hypothetical protein EDB85DRAFT_2179177 [Lactarius pseudohatsudake]